MQMCPEEDYSTVVEMLAMMIIDVKIPVGIKETKIIELCVHKEQRVPINSNGFK